MSAAVATAMPSDLKAQVAGKHTDRTSDGSSSEDLYTRLKTLQRQLEFLEIQVRRRYFPFPFLFVLTSPTRLVRQTGGLH